MTWQVLVNPHAGRRDSIADEIEDGLTRRRIDADVHETSSVEDLGSMARRAVDRGITRFVAVGGDGTAHHLLNALFTHDADVRYTLSILPVGSGSDFVRTFGQSGDVDAALDRLADPDLYPIDLGTIDGAFGRRVFLNAANAGVAAASVATSSRLPRFIGSLRYTAAFWLTLGRFREAGLDVAIDHHRFVGNAINVVVANGQFFGGGLNVAPRATLVDGKFDVLVFSGPRRNAFTVMPRLAFGAHLTHRAVSRYIGADVVLDVPAAWPIEADGEMLGVGPVTFGVLPAAVDYVV